MNTHATHMVLSKCSGYSYSVGTQLMDKQLLCFGAVRPTYSVVLATGPCKEGSWLLAVV